MKKAEAVAETAEDLWLARWHLWFMELDARRNTEALRRAGKIWDDARRKDLPLNEVENLKLLLQVGEDRLEEAQQGLRDAEAGDLKDVPGARIRLQYAEKQVGVVQKAYDASRADADILLSDRTSTPDPRALEISGYKGKVQQLTRDVEEYEREILMIRNWISQLPEGIIKRARRLARDVIVENERALEAILEQRRGVAKALEKYK